MENYELISILTGDELDTLYGLLDDRGEKLIKPNDPVTVGMAQLCFDAFGIIYDFRIKRFYREGKVRIITREELETIVDEYL